MAGYRTVKLSNSPLKAFVDSEDYEKITAYGEWYLSDTGYAVRRGKVHGKQSTIRMHRVIAEPPKGLTVDHINRKRLDNRKENLRIVTQAMNAVNGSGNFAHTVYKDLPKGVTYDYERSKYVARKMLYKRFDTLEEANQFMKGED